MPSKGEIDWSAVLSVMPLVKSAAKRAGLAKSQIDRELLYDAALDAAVRASTKYDATRDSKFVTLAWMCVANAIRTTVKSSRRKAVRAAHYRDRERARTVEMAFAAPTELLEQLAQNYSKPGPSMECVKAWIASGSVSLAAAALGRKPDAVKHHVSKWKAALRTCPQLMPYITEVWNAAEYQSAQELARASVDR